MNRFLVFTLVISIGNASAAFAGESLLESATRIASQSARTGAPQKVERSASRSAGVFGQAVPAVTTSAMKKRTKIMIFLAAGIGFAATAYAIDRKVQDVTPSSLGTRED